MTRTKTVQHRILAVMVTGLCALTTATAQNIPAPTPEQLAAARAATEARLAKLAAKPTPRSVDGHPDLTGLWFSRQMGSEGFGFDTKRGSDGSVSFSFAKDPEMLLLFVRSMQKTQEPPQYKPEFQARLKELQSGNLNRTDNTFVCGHPGLPRIGTPQQIVQTRGQVVFLYADLAGKVFRVIPTDGRAHRDIDPTFYGDSVARWEGDTLVVETINFVTDTWIGEDAFFHSEQLKIIERLQRKGETMKYDLTVEDPGVLAKPWSKPTSILTLSQTPIDEPYPCDPRLAEKSFDTGRHDQRAK